MALEVCVETPFNPVLLSLGRLVREEGLELPPDLRNKKRAQIFQDKYDILESSLLSLGEPFLERLGRQVATLDSHPLVHGLASAPTLDEMFLRWLRVERHLHPHQRVEACLRSPNSLEITRFLLDDTQPFFADDLLATAIVVGFLDAFGLTGVRYEFVLRAEVRSWILSWDPKRAIPKTREEGPWGIGGRDARDTFVVLLERSNLSLERTARAVGVSARTLQRRLEDAGTNFNEMTRVARVTRAGRGLLETDETITNIALSSGFSDGAHLSREFRALIGVAPNDFRRSLR